MTEEQQKAISKRNSASAEDGDQHLLGDAAAQAESARIDQWTKSTFAGGGRHQSQLDPEYGFKERKPR